MYPRAETAADDQWDEVGVALRLFLDRSHAVLRQPDGKASLREALVGAQPYKALLLLMTRSPDFRSEFLREILMAVIDGPHRSLLLARDVVRSLPRAVLEETTPDILADLLRSADDYRFSRAAEILVETRLRDGLEVFRSMARNHNDADIRDLVSDLENVEEDEQRWGRLVQEWPIRDGLK
jgi:hypothetical protein